MPPELDAFVAGTLAEWELPGAAVAIVKDGRVVAAQGHPCSGTPAAATARPHRWRSCPSWLDAGALHLRYGGGEPATLEHWHHDTFRVHGSNPWHDADPSTLIAFTLDAGRATQLHTEPFGDPIDARRLAPE